MREAEKVYNYQKLIKNLPLKAPTLSRSAHPRCSGAALASIASQHGLVHALCQRQEVFPSLTCGLELPPARREQPQSPQHGEALRGLPHLLAEGAGGRRACVPPS
jgi:hypothetical protein